MRAASFIANSLLYLASHFTRVLQLVTECRLELSNKVVPAYLHDRRRASSSCLRPSFQTSPQSPHRQ
jgi:hypothetical protein